MFEEPERFITIMRTDVLIKANSLATGKVPSDSSEEKWLSCGIMSGRVHAWTGSGSGTFRTRSGGRCCYPSTTTRRSAATSRLAAESG
jgi:hypothetical protein